MPIGFKPATCPFEQHMTANCDFLVRKDRHTCSMHDFLGKKDLVLDTLSSYPGHFEDRLVLTFVESMLHLLFLEVHSVSLHSLSRWERMFLSFSLLLPPRLGWPEVWQKTTSLPYSTVRGQTRLGRPNFSPPDGFLL